MSKKPLNSTMVAQSSQSINLVLASEADTKRLAEYLARLNICGSIWLSGDLGAGKTTLTRYWLKALGHTGTVKSPTYTLVEPYQLDQQNSSGNVFSKPVYHVDLYRLQDPEELSFIGFDEYQDDPNALLIIEWPSRAEDYIAKPVMTINIRQVEGENNQREVQLQAMQVPENCNCGNIDLSGLSKF